MMRNQSFHSRVLTVAAALPLLFTPLFAQQDAATESLAWLESLAVEGRSRLQTDAEAPRLFEEMSDDGRTWFETIVDDIASGNWTQVDEAILICLAEAEHMKEQAEAVVGTAAETAYHEARKEYLAGAAKLLDAYRAAAGLIVDDVVAPLMALPDLPDLTLPSTIPNTEVRLHEIAGSGQINTDTLAFSGRLNARIEIPGFESTLAVPNLSFDSYGNFDLTAYGNTSFPPNDPGGVRLAIPARRPLDLHFGADGDWSAAGGLRIRFPDGNTVEGFMDMNDPNYAFGFSFSGKIALELAKEITLFAPTFTIDTSTPEARAKAMATVGAFGGFFGSFGRGLETFIDETSGLPGPEDINVGTAPDFKDPELPIPFDLLGAWLSGVGNATLRPLANGGADVWNNSFGAAREMFQSMSAELNRERSPLVPTHDLLVKLQHIGQVYEQYGSLSAAAQSGLSPAEQDALLNEVQGDIAFTVQLAETLVATIPNEGDFRLGLAALRVYRETAAIADQVLAGSGIPVPAVNSNLVHIKLNAWADQVLARYGLTLVYSDPEDVSLTVFDPIRYDALSAQEMRVLRRFLAAVPEHHKAYNGDYNPAGWTEYVLELSERLLDGLAAEYDAAQTDGDFARRAVAAQQIFGEVTAAEFIGLELPTAQQVALMGRHADALNEITVVGNPQETLARARQWQAAAVELCTLGNKEAREAAWLAGGKPEAYDEDDFLRLDRLQCGRDFEGYQAYLSGLSGAEKTAAENSILSFLEAYSQSAEFFDNVEAVEADLGEAIDRLTFWANAWAFTASLFPGEVALLDELELRWQALHVPVVGVAQAQKMHWYLAAYMNELSRLNQVYLDALPEAALDAMITAGTEAGQALETVIDGLSLVVANLEPFQFQLPGDIEIESVFGEIAFNRVIPSWDVAFGGSLSFPDIGARFAIPSATIDSSGNFSLSLSAFPIRPLV